MSVKIHLPIIRYAPTHNKSKVSLQDTHVRNVIAAAEAAAACRSFRLHCGGHTLRRRLLVDACTPKYYLCCELLMNAMCRPVVGFSSSSTVCSNTKTISYHNCVCRWRKTHAGACGIECATCER